MTDRRIGADDARVPGNLQRGAAGRHGAEPRGLESSQLLVLSVCAAGEKLRGKVLMSCELRALSGVDEGWKDDGYMDGWMVGWMMDRWMIMDGWIDDGYMGGWTNDVKIYE